MRNNTYRNHAKEYEKHVQTCVRCIIPFYLLFGLLIILIPEMCFAAFDLRPAGVRGMGMAVTPVCEPEDIMSRISNPAAASWQTGWGFSSFFLRQWDLPALDNFYLSAFVPYNRWAFDISASGFGKTPYSERNIGVSSSYRVLTSLATGIRIRIKYGQVEIAKYGSDNVILGSWGTVARFKYFDSGLVLEDIVSSDFKKFGDTPLPCLRAVVGFQITEKTRLYVEYEGQQYLPPGFRGGIEIQAMSPLVLLAGYDQAADRIHLGISLKVSSSTAYAAYDNHPLLGWSKAFGYTWLNKKNESSD